MGALTFGFLPTIFLPAGPMTSGMPNDHKAKVRKDFALGKISRKQLLDSEMQSYHGPGTCTFYGTANSNQMLMEVMGLHIPGSAFINPHDDLRHMLTVYTTEKLVAISRQSKNCRPIGKIVDEKSLVDALTRDKIGGAGLDVVPQEPLPIDHPLWEMDNVLITPHTAGGSPNRNERCVALFCANLRRYLDCLPLLSVVDKLKGY